MLAERAGVTLVPLELGDLIEEVPGIDHDAVADHADLAAAQDADWSNGAVQVLTAPLPRAAVPLPAPRVPELEIDHVQAAIDTLPIALRT